VRVVCRQQLDLSVEIRERRHVERTIGQLAPPAPARAQYPTQSVAAVVDGGTAPTVLLLLLLLSERQVVACARVQILAQLVEHRATIFGPRKTREARGRRQLLHEQHAARRARRRQQHV